MGSELSAYLAIAAAGAAYWAYSNKSALYEYVFRVVDPPAPKPVADWRSRWVPTLLSLQSDLEQHGLTDAAPHVRAILWSVLGMPAQDEGTHARARGK